VKQLIIIALLLTATFQAQGEANAERSKEQRAVDLIDEMEELYRQDSSKASLAMTIETPQYKRTLEMQAISQGVENSFIRIVSPKKDRGISTLKLDMEMWNFFPKINKVIKVPPSMMMGSWMGSDFTNDDLVKQTTLTEEYDLALEETEDQYRITLTPKEQTVTVWGRIDYTIDREQMVPVSQLFYDDDGTLVRRLDFKEPREFSGHLLPSVLEMVPLNKEGHKTIVRYEELEFNPPDVTDRDFTLHNLKSRF
jgi:hypothetical protein